MSVRFEPMVAARLRSAMIRIGALLVPLRLIVNSPLFEKVPLRKTMVVPLEALASARSSSEALLTQTDAARVGVEPMVTSGSAIAVSNKRRRLIEELISFLLGLKIRTVVGMYGASGQAGELYTRVYDVQPLGLFREKIICWPVSPEATSQQGR